MQEHLGSNFIVEDFFNDLGQSVHVAPLNDPKDKGKEFTKQSSKHSKGVKKPSHVLKSPFVHRFDSVRKFVSSVKSNMVFGGGYPLDEKYDQSLLVYYTMLLELNTFLEAEKVNPKGRDETNEADKPPEKANESPEKGDESLKKVVQEEKNYIAAFIPQKKILYL